MLEKGKIWILKNVQGRNLDSNASNILDLYVSFLLLSILFSHVLEISYISFFFPVYQQEREEYEYEIIEKKIVHKLTGKFLDTMHGSEGTKWIFVMSTFKKLYAGLVS